MSVWSIKPGGGGDFTSLQAANDIGSTSAGDTFSCDEDAVCQSGSLALSKGVTVTASGAHAVVAPTAAEAGSKARISVTGDGGLNLDGAGAVFEKIGVIYAAGTVGYVNRVATVRRCVFSGGARSLRIDGNSGSIAGTVIDNCAFFGFTVEAVRCGGGADTTVVHCSAEASNSAFAAFEVGGGGATGNFYGNVAQGVPGNDSYFGTFNGDYNVSQDATAPGSASTKYARSTSGWFANTGAGTEDLSLAVGKQGWWAANKDAIDQTGWPADVATDIVGTARAAPIDPGVWQTPAAAPPAATGYTLSLMGA